jgi:hypothetical protein
MLSCPQAGLYYTVGIQIPDNSSIPMADFRKSRASDNQTIKKPDTFIELVWFY